MKNRILLVDDDKDLLQTFRDILEGEGYIVKTAKTGMEALKLASLASSVGAAYNLAIIDIKLPDVMGDEVISRLKIHSSNQGYTMVFILITGFPLLRDAIDTLSLGIHEILIKPIGGEELLRVTREALFSSYQTEANTHERN